MDPQRWRKVRRALDAALELSPGERPRALEEICAGDSTLYAEVESMIRAFDAGGTLLDSPAVVSADSLFERAPLPERLGPYRILEPVGEGGMATVYRALRDDGTYQQEVAVKLLRWGRDREELLRRIRSERQILAGLDHPNIAKLLDGGSTEDGRPYLVLEFVRGEPLNVHCERRNLSLAERLDLFLELCSAIEFAHRNLVVHRDLKPSNVLVTEDGQVKLLDFGIAKILQPEAFPQTIIATRTGLLPMTPDYASPEQIRGRPITTATDVYSLGVLLYILLTGRHPYPFDDRDLASMVEAVCQQEPRRPSTRVVEGGRRLAGDLDSIALTALAKDPEARYPSVAALADDLRRYRTGRPLWARAGSPWYRASKFVRRHRWSVATATLTFLLLVGFIAALLVQQQRILHERNRAESIAEWLIDLFSQPEPSRSLGETVTARQLLDKGSRSVGGSLIEDKALQGDLMATMGRTYAALGLLKEGLDLLERSVEAARDPSAGKLVLAQRLRYLAEARTTGGDFEGAETAAQESLALRRQVLGARSPETAIDLALLGHLNDLEGHREEARVQLGQALELARRQGDADTLVTVLEYLGALRWNLDDPQGAQEAYREALDLLRARHGSRHPRVALLTSNLAQALQWSDAEEAERLFRGAIEEQRAVFGETHPVLATALNNLGMLYYEQRRWQDAEPLLARALSMQRDLYGEVHSKVAATLMNLGNVKAQQGSLGEAEAAFGEALEIYSETLGKSHDRYALCLNNLGELKLRQGHPGEGEALLERALDITRKSLGEEHRQNAAILGSLGQAALVRRDLPLAIERLQEAVALARKGPGPAAPFLGPALANLGSAYSSSQRFEEAAASFEESLGLLEHPGGDPRLALQIRTQLAHLRLELGDPTSAEALARDALEAWRSTVGESHVWSLAAQGILWRSLQRLGRHGEAEPLILDGLAKMEAAESRDLSRLERAREDLARLYDLTDRPDLAALQRERLAKERGPDESVDF